MQPWIIKRKEMSLLNERPDHLLKGCTFIYKGAIEWSEMIFVFVFAFALACSKIGYRKITMYITTVMIEENTNPDFSHCGLAPVCSYLSGKGIVSGQYICNS